MTHRLFWTALALIIMASRPMASSALERTYSLQDAYAAALTTNESIKIEQESLYQSDARVDQARTYLFPRVTGQAGYTRYNEVLPPGDSSFVFQPLSQLSGALLLTQPIYTGGRTLAALRTAQTLRAISARELSSARQNLMLNVANAFYAVLKAQNLVEKSSESVTRMEHHQTVTEREASTRKTKANISNLLRARTLVSQARITLTRDENNLQVVRQKLRLLTGLSATADLSDPAPEEPVAESLELLTSIALAQRNDYAAAELNRKIAEENITLVKGAHAPQVNAEGALRYVESHPGTLTDGTIYYGGIRLQVPIFEGGLMSAELAEARSKLRQAELLRDYLRKSIETEVYEAHMYYQTITSVLKAAEKQYQDAKANFDAVQDLFAQGLLGSLALIDAQQALFLAEREMVSARYDRQVAILTLKRSIGTLGTDS